MNKLGQGVFLGADSACFLQSASYFLAESKVLGEGKTGKKNCPQLQNLERVDVNTVNPPAPLSPRITHP